MAGLAFLTVVIVWATTPLLIDWSTLAFSPELAAGLRMGLGAICAYAILKVSRLKLYWDKASIKGYAAGALGLFGGIYLAYLSIRHIPSGLLSVCYSITPMLSAFLGHRFLKEAALSFGQWAALCFAAFGLLLIFFAQDHSEDISTFGLLLAIASAALYVISVIYGKKTQGHMQPIQTLTGALIFSAAGFFIVWLIVGAQLPDLSVEDADKSLLSIIYLAIIGSVSGFLAFFYMVKHINSTLIALPTVITPIIALALGFLLNNEQLPALAIAGAAVVIIALIGFVYSRQLQAAAMNKPQAAETLKFKGRLG